MSDLDRDAVKARTEAADECLRTADLWELKKIEAYYTTDVPALLAALKEAEDALAETVPKSWGGLIELLNEAYPEDIFPVLPDEPTRDQGPRILSLVRLLNRERTRAESAERRIAAVEAAWYSATELGDSGVLYTDVGEAAMDAIWAALHPVAETEKGGKP